MPRFIPGGEQPPSSAIRTAGRQAEEEGGWVEDDEGRGGQTEGNSSSEPTHTIEDGKVILRVHRLCTVLESWLCHQSSRAPELKKLLTDVTGFGQMQPSNILEKRCESQLVILAAVLSIAFHMYKPTCCTLAHPSLWGTAKHVSTEQMSMLVLCSCHPLHGTWQWPNIGIAICLALSLSCNCRIYHPQLCCRGLWLWSEHVMIGWNEIFMHRVTKSLRSGRRNEAWMIPLRVSSILLSDLIVLLNATSCFHVFYQHSTSSSKHSWCCVLHFQRAWATYCGMTNQVIPTPIQYQP